VALLLCIGAVSMTLALLNHSSAAQFSRTEMGQRAKEVTGLLAKLGGGPLKYSKPELLAELLHESQVGSNAMSDFSLAIDASKTVVVGDPGRNPARLAIRDLALSALKTQKPQVSPDGLAVAYPVYYGGAKTPVGAIATHWNMAAVNAKLHDQLLAAMAWVTGVFVLAMALGIFFLRNHIAGPLTRLAEAVRRVADEDYATEVPCRDRQDEVGQIGRALEELRLQLAQSAEAMDEAAFKSAAFEASSAAMMLVDENRAIRFANREMKELLTGLRDEIAANLPDFDPERILGGTIDDFHTDASQVRHLLSDIDNGTVSALMALQRSRIKLKASAVRDSEGDPIGAVVEWSDVTNTASNEAILQSINANQARAEFDIDGQLVDCNARFAEALDSSVEALTGRSLTGLLDADWQGGTDREALLQTAAEGTPVVGRIEFATEAGDKATLEASLSSVRDTSGTVFKYLLLGRDVTADEAQLAGNRAARIEMQHQLARVVDALKIGLRHMRDGDLSLRISDPFDAEYEELRADYNGTMDTLSTTVRELTESASGIHGEARDISTNADALSRRTESTAATLEETAAALDHLTTSVQSAAEGAARADHEVSDMRQSAERSGEIVMETVEAMDRISSFSEKITSITKVIEDIAFQTNLLALNAGVEAARAGDAGRGFAVVASEVRALAQRCTEAAREINELIADSGSHVKRGVELVGQTGTALKEIVQSIAGIATLVSEIAASAQQQSTGLAEINAAVNDLDQSTQQNAARLEETTAASQSLTDDAMVMVETMSHFKLANADDGANVVAMSSRGTEPAGRRQPAKPAQTGEPDLAGPPAPRRAAAAAAEAAPAPDDDGWSDY
jgi:methyl-accepting chemotaxis protein